MREASIETHQHKGDLKELSRSGKSKELARDWEPAPKMKMASASPDWNRPFGSSFAMASFLVTSWRVSEHPSSHPRDGNEHVVVAIRPPTMISGMPRIAPTTVQQSSIPIT